MARSEKLTDHTLQVSLPDSLYRLLKAAASRGDQSLAEIVRRAITYYLDRLLYDDRDLRTHAHEVLHIVNVHMDNVEELREDLVKRHDSEGTHSPAAEEVLRVSEDYRRAVARLTNEVEKRFEIGGVWDPDAAAWLRQQVEIEKNREKQIQKQLQNEAEQKKAERYAACKPAIDKHEELVREFPQDRDAQNREWAKWLSSREGEAVQKRMASAGMAPLDKTLPDKEPVRPARKRGSEKE